MGKAKTEKDMQSVQSAFTKRILDVVCMGQTQVEDSERHVLAVELELVGGDLTLDVIKSLSIRIQNPGQNEPVICEANERAYDDFLKENGTIKGPKPIRQFTLWCTSTDAPIAIDPKASVGIYVGDHCAWHCREFGHITPMPP